MKKIMKRTPTSAAPAILLLALQQGVLY